MAEGLSAFLGGFGGAAAGSAFVRLILQDGPYKTSLKSAESSTVKSTSTMGAASAKMGKLQAAAWAAAGAVVVKFAADSLKAYQDSQVALARLSVAVGGATDAYEEQAAAIQRLTGFQDEEVMAAQAVLAQFKLTEAQIRGLIPLVADYARATGTDMETAAKNLGLALLGNTRALKAVGIDFQATGNKARDLATIMALLEDRVGGAAEAFAGTTAGKLALAAAQFDELKETVGQLISQALLPVIGVVSNVLSGFNMLPGPVKTVVVAVIGLNVAMALLSKAATLVTSNLAAAGISATAFGSSVQTATPYLGAFLSFLQQLGQESNADQNVQKVADALTAGAVSVKELKSALDGGTSQELADLSDKLGLVGPLGLGMADAIRGGIAAFEATPAPAEAAADALAALEEALGGTEEEAISAKDAIFALIGAQQQLAGGMLGMVSAAHSATDAERELKESRAELAELTAAGKQGTDEYAAAQRRYRDATLGTVQAQANLESSILGVMESIENGTSSRAQAISDIRRMGREGGLTSGQISNLIAMIRNIPDSSYTKITVDRAEAVAAVADFINLVYSIPSVRQVHVQVVGAPQLPGYLPEAEGGINLMHAGGITRGPTRIHANVIAGEGSYATPFGKGAEAVIPLNDATMDRLAAAITRRGGGGVLKVYGPGDPDLIADAVMRRMARMR